MIENNAEGKVLIYNKQNREQVLIQNTRLLTPEGILFRMKNREVIPANGELEVDVYADEKGTVGNIGPSQFIIPGLSDSLRLMVYAESLSAMDGGLRKVGILTESDLEAAKNSYKEQIKQKFLEDNNIDENNKAVAINIGEITSDKKVGDNVDSFVLSANAEIIIVEFDNKKMNEYIDKELSGQVDRTVEKFLRAENKINFDLVAYDIDKGTAEVVVIQDAIVTLDANAEKLNIINFAGKKKDEIERYILSIDHVKDVEVKFSPSWMRTAPAVADRIKVVVKSGGWYED